MPLARLVCPHCENSVEVNVTNVTRSRACPRCSRQIMLQFTTRTSHQKHRALLMEMDEEALTAAGPAVAPAATAVAPRPLQGDVRSRMRQDPEVRSSARSLLLGGVVFLFLLLGVVLGNHFHWWDEIVAGWGRLQATMVSSTAKKEDKKAKSSVPPLTVARMEEAIAGSSSAARVAESFLAAKNVEDRLAFVRDRELMDVMVRKYYMANKDGPIEHFGIKVSPESPSGEDEKSFIVDLGGDGQRLLHAFKSADGSFKVDWASFVVHSEMSREEFLTKKPKSAVFFRVLALEDNYYNEVFPDERRLACVKLLDPLNPSAPPFYGYISRTSAAGRSLDYILRKAFGQEVPMVLTLRFPEEGAASAENQVWIEEVVAEGWVAQGR